MNQSTPNKFQKWLEDFGGSLALANRLGVSEYAVKHWRRGYGWPHLVIILEIVKLSKGKLTIEDIIECTYPKSKRG